KRSVVLNLKTDEGKEIARRLIREADVVAENLGPGAMERLGLGYEAVKKLHPRAIYASIKGFGSYGPYSDFKCFEMIAQATSGGMSLTGFPDRPPVVTGVNVGDAGTGMHLTIAILAALVQRQRTGRGQLVEVAMQEAVLNITRVKFTPTLTNGRPLERMGNRSASGAYADLVRCAAPRPSPAGARHRVRPRASDARTLLDDRMPATAVGLPDRDVAGPALRRAHRGRAHDAGGLHRRRGATPPRYGRRLAPRDCLVELHGGQRRVVDDVPDEQDDDRQEP